MKFELSRELTVKERLYIYEYARNILLEDMHTPTLIRQTIGMCGCLRKSFNQYARTLEYGDPLRLIRVFIHHVVEVFPELLEYKPENAALHEYWWYKDDYTTRISVFNEIIDKLNTKLKTENHE